MCGMRGNGLDGRKARTARKGSGAVEGAAHEEEVVEEEDLALLRARRGERQVQRRDAARARCLGRRLRLGRRVRARLAHVVQAAVAHQAPRRARQCLHEHAVLVTMNMYSLYS